MQPDSTDHFSFVFIGDVQDTLRGKTRGFMENVRHRYPQADFYMFAGDFAERPMNCYWDEAYQSVDSIAPTKPILVSPGNHEYVKGLVRVLEKRFAYVFSYLLESRYKNNNVYSVAAENMYNAIKDVVANAEGQVIIGEVNQDATAQNIQQRGGGFIDKMIELLQADGKTVAVKGNEFYVNAAKGADAKEADADVVIQVAVPAQTTVELCSTEAQAILSQENCIAIFGSNQTAAEGVLAANANLNVLGSDAAAGDVIGVGFDAGSIIKAAVQDGTFIGAVTQSPLMMGYYAIYALTAAANGQELEDVPTDGYWYDSTNMDSEEIAPNLYD